MSQNDITNRLHDYGAKFSQIDPEYLLCLEAAAEIDRLRVALAAQQDGAWQPIETAPRDGSAFLAWQGEERGPFKCWWHNDWAHAEHFWMDHQDSEPDPAYWQPLPADPEQTRST